MHRAAVETQRRFRLTDVFQRDRQIEGVVGIVGLQLVRLEEGLLRITEGSYGFCEETGEPIGVRRLLARPTATLTIEAQTRREQRQKLYGD